MNNKGFLKKIIAVYRYLIVCIVQHPATLQTEVLVWLSADVAHSLTTVHSFGVDVEKVLPYDTSEIASTREFDLAQLPKS